MEGSEAVETAVKEKAKKLEHYNSHITACRVVIEKSHAHHQQGNLFHVRIDLTVPQGELVANRDTDDHSHEDVYVAIRDAFAAAKKQMDRHMDKLRGDVKNH